MKIEKPKMTAGRLLVYALLSLLAVLILVPLAWVILASLKQNSEFYGNPWVLPQTLYFQNYKDAWTTARMGDFFLNSVLSTAIGIALLLVLALPAAYVLSRFKFKLRPVINTLLKAGLFINVSYIIVPIFLMLIDGEKALRAWGWLGKGESAFLNNMVSLGLVYASTALPFTIYLLSGYFAGLPKAYEEAAYIDGATNAQTMVRIMFPLAKPSIITVILFNFLAFWNEYVIAMTLLSDPKGPKTLSVGLMNLMKAQNAAANYGQMYAGLVIILLPTLILYIFVQKKLTQGMTLGGLKG